MKILQIASVFPAEPGSLSNPYVKNFTLHYLLRHPSDVLVIKPVPFLPRPLLWLSDKKDFWRGNAEKCRKGKYVFEALPIHIFPFFSIGSKSALHTFFSFFVFSFNKKKIDELASRKFDLIHAHFLFPDGVLAYRLSKKYKIPYFLTIRQELRFLKNPFSRYWVKKLIKNATAVSTHSVQMLEGLKKNGMTHIQFLPTGIEEYFLINSHEAKTQLAENRQEKLKLLSVCNLLPIKNLEATLTAISCMEEKEKIDYTIYGTGPLEQELKNRAQELKIDHLVHFKGPARNKDLPALMPQHDVFVQPSFKETFGLAYFEALACGLPVILTKNTGAYELIKDHNVYYTVDPYDPDTIVSCLQGILTDRETLKRKSALAPGVAKIASWQNFVDYFHEEYEKVVTQPIHK